MKRALVQDAYAAAEARMAAVRAQIRPDALALDARLEAGELVLAGSFTRPMWVYPGDTVFADYGPMGAVTCRFV